MKNILEQYYRGISRQLRSEVDFINSIFEHQGLKGEGNENILRDLIKRFIPKKFGIGTGIVIDKNGKQSKQIDIIIYDQMNYPSILSLASVHIFPVDIVYAVIEVKTTLNSEKAKEALENIASVRTLELIPENYSVVEQKDGKIAFNTHAPTPPRGIVFSYNSIAESFETFKGWFTPKAKDQAIISPVLVGCLDQGIVRFKNANIFDSDESEPDKFTFNGFFIPVNDGNNKSVCFTEKKVYEKNDAVYPVKKVGDYYCPVDQSRVLLFFLLSLTELIKKVINPNINFSEHYLDELMRLHIPA